MRVSNRKVIRRLSFKSMKAAKLRNIIAILAIALTTVLFTALFTIAISISYSFEQSNFRQVGGYSHGGFKYLTKEQVEELREDSLIDEWALRQFVGMPSKYPFNKTQVEISYADDTWAKWGFLEPKEGKYPTEGTREAAADVEVLKLLGIDPLIGTEFTMTFDVDGKETTETFTLCGYWEHDEVAIASHVIIAQSMAEEIYDKLDTKGLDGMTTSYNLDVMLKSNADIENDLNTILENHGYQSHNRNEDNYIGIGVNWGYVSAQLSASMDFTTLLSIIAILLLIVFTGYLIIYNVFQISVSNDIRFYGLLKTIGTTGKQLKRIILWQALCLAVIGIPIGLVIGYGIGAVLTPIVMGNLNGVNVNDLSVSPVIFIGASLFSLVTVIISCHKPAKAAAKVSAIEAVRYTEKSNKTAKIRRKKTGASLYKMAFANMGRNKSKTIITIVSMSLAVVLLNVTFLFANGFDMDKYVGDRMTCDFIVGDATYFNVMPLYTSSEDTAVTEDIISELQNAGKIADGGRTYGLSMSAQEFVTEEWMRKINSRWYSDEILEEMLSNCEKEDGLYQTRVQLYGMEKFCLDKCKVFEGDITKLYEPGNYVAAVYYMADDYGNIGYDSNWAKLGDKVKVRYVKEWEYYNTKTGEIYNNTDELTQDMSVSTRAKSYYDKEYEVAALIVIPSSLSYRYYGADEFVLNAETFKADTQSDNIMYYTYDMDKSDLQSTDHMEVFIKNLTQNINTQYDYESKMTYMSEFKSFQSMFTLMGAVLSFIVGLVGILNFLNAILTGIITRRREFAVLQSVGMTGKQLKTMLVYEGLIYSISAILTAVIFDIVMGPFVGDVLSSMFWFFTYKFTIAPILAIAPIFVILGIMLPLLTYHYMVKKSIVERLREAE